MSDNIPFEIQLEIIKKVPDVKSLLRFRGVSKPWKSFIDSSEFITGFGARKTQPRSLLLRYYTDNSNEVKYVTFVDDVTFPQQQQLDFSPNVPDLVKQLKYSQVIGQQLIYSNVIGSSCGLWCLHDYNSSETEMVVIWNPSIRKSVGIVVPCELKITSERFNRFGFGVCPSTYDPTIVAMSWFFGMNTTCQVGIFTLSSKAWKMIPSSNVPRESIRLGSSIQVAIDRFIFWVAFGESAGNDGVLKLKNVILSFDLITHEFNEVNLPDSIAKISVYPFISKLSESLVVSAYTNEVNGQVYGVWMMGEEGGVMTSFTKLFNINTPDDSWVNKILGFTMSGKPIIETDMDDGESAVVKVYEPCSEHIINLGIYGEEDSFFICLWKETLLLADHSGGCTISNDY